MISILKELIVKTFNKPQSVFIFGIMIAFTWFAASFAFFVLYFNQIKSVRPLKAVFKAIDAYSIEAFTHSLIMPEVSTDIRIIAYMALCAGFLLYLHRLPGKPFHHISRAFSHLCPWLDA